MVLVCSISRSVTHSFCPSPPVLGFRVSTWWNSDQDDCLEVERRTRRSPSPTSFCSEWTFVSGFFPRSLADSFPSFSLNHCSWTLFTQDVNMHERYIEAARYGTSQNLFVRISELFLRRLPDTETGPGVHYLADLVVTNDTLASAFRVVQLVCENQDIPVLDFRNPPVTTIRDLVTTILQKTPPRCAILLDVRDHGFLQKVRARIAGKCCDLRFRRVIFCLTTDPALLPSPAIQIAIPGSLQDRLTMLLYHLPAPLRAQAQSLDEFLPVAEAMLDYALFEPRRWQEVCVDGTLAAFLSTALYQLARRGRADPPVDPGAYPSFEQNWRRLLASRLQESLSLPPTTICPSIHRVIPVGVSSSDALHAMEVAIPPNLPNPYVVTVQASAVDDQCGSIAIAQPLRYTVVHLHYTVNPGILVDVCRELRLGHRAVVSEVHRMNQRHDVMSQQQETLHRKQDETNQQLAAIKHEMTALVARLTPADPALDGTCSKTGCGNLVTRRFKSGKRKKQCTTCLSHFHKPHPKRKSCV